MPKFFCDYCDVYLTHDSISVRKAHNSGRNHIRNVVDYYQQIGQEKAQSVIDTITSSYAAEGQTMPSMFPGAGPSGFGAPPFGALPGGPAPFGMPSRPGMPPFPLPMPGMPGAPPLPLPGMPGAPPMPPGFPMMPLPGMPGAPPMPFPGIAGGPAFGPPGGGFPPGMGMPMGAQGGPPGH